MLIQKFQYIHIILQKQKTKRKKIWNTESQPGNYTPIILLFSREQNSHFDWLRLELEQFLATLKKKMIPIQTKQRTLTIYIFIFICCYKIFKKKLTS